MLKRVQTFGTAAGLDDTVNTALVGVRVLDTIVRNTCRNTPATLAEWITARRIAHAPQTTEPAPQARRKPQA